MEKKSKRISKYGVGAKVSYLTILKTIGSGVGKKVLCKCVCGKEKEFYISNIVPKPNARYTISCGCKRAKIVSDKNSTHKMSKTKFYKRWRSMYDRISPKYICAKDYIGVTVCDRWKNFENFYRDMYSSYQKHREIYGERQTTLDRINPYGNYELTNCRWATFREQTMNKKANYKQKIKEL